jgi:hypothetical protein
MARLQARPLHHLNHRWSLGDKINEKQNLRKLVDLMVRERPDLAFSLSARSPLGCSR